MRREVVVLVVVFIEERLIIGVGYEAVALATSPTVSLIIRSQGNPVHQQKYLSLLRSNQKD